MSTSSRWRKPESPIHKFRGGVRTECGEIDTEVRWTQDWKRVTCQACKDRRATEDHFPGREKGWPGTEGGEQR